MTLPRGPKIVVVEFVEGCLQGCRFCGIHAIRPPGIGGFNFMRPETLHRVAQGILDAGWMCVVDVSGHGEPTMHPEWHEMLLWLCANLSGKQISKTHPEKTLVDVVLTTGGGGLLARQNSVPRLLELFGAGLSALAVGDYWGSETAARMLELGPYIAQLSDAQFGWYPDYRVLNPYEKDKPKRVVMMRSPPAIHYSHRLAWSNQAGAAAPIVDPPKISVCHRPWLEMFVRWDGEVVLCAEDWHGEFRAGSVLDKTVEEVWHGSALDAVRRRLWLTRAGIGPCSRCSRKMSSSGLEFPGTEDVWSLQALEEAQASPPLSPKWRSET